MMTRFCWCFLLLSLFAGLCRTQSDNNGAKPINVTVVEASTSLQVYWTTPNRTENLESYRIRVFPTVNEGKKRVQWVSPGAPLQETISCLEPGTIYEVQVIARYHKGRNLTDESSEVVRVTTTPITDPGFLSEVWEQRMYVLIGVGLTVVVFLFFSPCIFCCCYNRRRSFRLNKDDRGKQDNDKSSALPSASELQRREQEAQDEDRYSVDPVRPLAFRTMESTTNSIAPLVDSPPPAYSSHRRGIDSYPREQAPCPPVQLPDENDDVFDDDNDYQNNVFGNPPGMELYANQAFAPRHNAQDASIYGNCQF